MLQLLLLKKVKLIIKGCDNIFEWFEENYEPAYDEVAFVEDVFNTYKSGDEFYQLSKVDKRKNGTAKKFKDILQGNLFIRKFYKEKDQYWNKIKYKKPFIAGWKRIVLATENNDCDIDSDTTTVVNS